MKKLLLLSTVILFTTILSVIKSYAQVAINNDGSLPHPSAMLDVKHPNKGILIPRVALTGATDIVTIPSPSVSLLVYNTSNGVSVTPGYYYWDGNSWVRLGASGPPGLNNAWLLTGNAGTVDGTNFIGTTDNVPFTVRVNNQRAGRIDHFLGNTFWGYQAGNTTITAAGNTAIGFESLFSNSLGDENTAIGLRSLKLNTSGTANTASGYVALHNNTTGRNNTATGRSALFANTTGFSNVAVGVRSLFTNTTASNLVAVGDSALFNNTGQRNTAVGSKSLYFNTIGNWNTANGHWALYSNTEGQFNTAMGAFASSTNSTGDGNTAIGFSALSNNQRGNNNTALGYEADVISSGLDLTNTTAIGYKATVNASNKIRLGNTAVTVIEGQVAYSFPSDARFKYNVQNNVPGLDFITKLQPVTYYFDEQKLAEYNKTGVLRQAQDNSMIRPASYTGEKQLHTGFLAQDVEKIANDLGYSFDGVHAPANSKDHYSLAYSQFIMPLVKSVQEQQQLIEEQKKTINEQQKVIGDIMKRLVVLEKSNGNKQ